MTKGFDFSLLVGRRFGRLVVAEYNGRDLRRMPWFAAVCDCGRNSVVNGYKLTSGHTRSCGCLVGETFAAMLTKHGKHGTAEYRIWKGMNERCYTAAQPAFKHYGGRGITVCERWRHDFAAFLVDMGPRPSSQHSLDRINNDGNYEPRNCRWATASEQGKNKRNNVRLTVGDETMCQADWSRRTGTSKTTIRERMRRGMSHADAVAKIRAA